MPPEERFAQEIKPKSKHYGCPAALGGEGCKSPVRFVVEEVIAIVRKALWPSEHVDMEHFMPLKKTCARQYLPLSRLPRLVNRSIVEQLFEDYTAKVSLTRKPRSRT